MRWLCALLLWALCGAAQAHEITFSHADIRMLDDLTQVQVELPVNALLQQDPPVLPAGADDAALRADDLSPELQAALSRLVTTRLHLKDGGRPLAITIEAVAPAGDDVAIVASTPPLTGALAFDANLFPDDPMHKLFVTVYHGDTLAGQYALDRQATSFTLAAPEQSVGEVIQTFINEGVHHIFIGPDHILFVLALVLLGGSLGSQVKIITAFTVAHSITLALATLNIVHAPSRLVESLIALSIVVVGVHDFLQLRRGAEAQAPKHDPRAAFAFGFGLVHGFGFANVLTELELPRYAIAWSLAAFNIGVEIGQVTIVLAAAPVLFALRRYAPARVTQVVLTAAACCVVLIGGYWFCQRALGFT